MTQELVRLLNHLGPNRSRTIDEAVRFYAGTVARKQIRKRLKEGAIRRAEQDLQIAAEWFLLEDEAWSRRQA